MNIYVRYIIIGILAMLLIVVRAFEDILFYDPFTAFFKEDLKNRLLAPEFNTGRLFFNHVCRYGINMVISVIILYLFFKDKGVLKLSLLLFLIVFVALVIPYFYYIQRILEADLHVVFYIRRFLIQPLLLFILFPAFLYHKRYIRNTNN